MLHHIIDDSHHAKAPQDPCIFKHSLFAYLAKTRLCVRVCPGVPAGAPRHDPGHLG